MSVISIDQLLETDRFVIEELFELHMDEPELSHEFQDLLRDENDYDPELDFDIGN